ncbi:methyl-CpG-binding domain-containing protein 7-like [Ipomoea triloba]|uniref:methyl-CpG-binding domain-containing protein 7-like n=1 Tax=Ipomoea triloba TaxID=35885 RepID=UPI00125D89A3|nr:methyl-CpG-binding domain-containing protein 7-like [Ipomoea triloba]
MKKSSYSSLRASSSRFPRPLQTPPFSLPGDWGVHDVPRSDGSKSDKYYLEPGTGKKLRSLREVERYLNGETVSRRRKSRVVIASNRPSSGISTSREERLASPPPSKVNWALASPQGDAWNPSIGETLISDAEKQEWRKGFVSALNMNNAVEERSLATEQQPPQAAAEENIIHQSVEEEGGLRRRSSRTKKLAYHRDFFYN